MTEYRDGYLYELDPPPGDVPGIPPRLPRPLVLIRGIVYAALAMFAVVVLAIEWWYR